MPFFEFLFLLSLTVLLPITIVKSVLEYKKNKHEAERGLGEGAGVTVGELKEMLAEVVREANAPLLERIEALEREREGLPLAGHRDLLADVEDTGGAEDADGERVGREWETEKSVGRRVHG